MKRKERVLILYNLAERLEKGIASDLICEQEISIIVPLITDLLVARGYIVETLLADIDLWENLKQRKATVDLVLNLAEAFGGGNTKETVVPAMLEGLDIPFTGASSRNMHLTLDKEKTKLVLASYGIPMAPHQLFKTGNEILLKELRFPMIVKPVREEASIGIYHDSVAVDEEMLRRKIEDCLQQYRQPALVERFIVGREISVGAIGNGQCWHVFPPLEFLFEGAGSELEMIRSYEYKWGGKKEQMVRAELPIGAIRQLQELTVKALVATDCRDYARVDYRLDDNNNPFLLEVNYNPGIGPNSHGLNNTLTRMASFEGLSFESLVERVVCIALERCREKLEL